MERMAISVAEAAKLMGVPVSSAYQYIHKAGFPVRKIGKRYLIPVKGLEAWLNQKGE